MRYRVDPRMHSSGIGWVHIQPEHLSPTSGEGWRYFSAHVWEDLGMPRVLEIKTARETVDKPQHLNAEDVDMMVEGILQKLQYRRDEDIAEDALRMAIRVAYARGIDWVYSKVE